MQNIFYEFREARNVEELEQIMHLRYRVYQNSRLHSFVEENSSGCDIDCYELQGYHFGIFRVENGKSKVIGFHRPVYDHPTPCAPVIRELVNRAGCGSEKLVPPMAPFSTMLYTPHSAAIMSLYDRVKASGKTMLESTKFGIMPEESSRPLAMRIIESAIAIHMIYRNNDYAIQACTPAHAAFYTMYGYEQIPGTVEFTYKGVVGNTIMLKSTNIPPRILPRLMRIAEAYAKTRKVIYNPVNPNDMYAPSEHFAVARAA